MYDKKLQAAFRNLSEGTPDRSTSPVKTCFSVGFES